MGLLTDNLEEVSGNSVDEETLTSYEETIVETVQNNFAEVLGLYGSTVDFQELISAVKDLTK